VSFVVNTLSHNNLLARIMAERLADGQAARRRVPVEDLQLAAEKRVHRSLIANLRSARLPRIIAEVKKASPSAGLLRKLYRPAAMAREYEAAGAAGVSVLTEPRHFLGSDEHLRQVRRAVLLPILRKDFIADAYQVCESAAWGADVVLLIAAAMDRGRLLDLYRVARGLRLEVIIEVHTAAELRLALKFPEAIIGVNNRNLKTLQTDLGVARRLAPLIPKDRLAIAESGIRTAAAVRRLQALGYSGFLIGESLLREGRPGDNLRKLIADE
jgi:indole-3-glycerol phosphate synthase